MDNLISSEEFRAVLDLIYSCGENDGLRPALSKPVEGREKVIDMGLDFIRRLSQGQK